MKIRMAQRQDAAAMSEVLNDLAAAGKRRKPGDPAFARLHYILHPDRIQCALAVRDDGYVCGFQSLKLAHDGNRYGTPAGWGIIGTHVRPTCARQGAGRLLFSASMKAAKLAGLPAIEAYIGANNAEAIRYYDAMGFVTYRLVEGVECKRIRVS